MRARSMRRACAMLVLAVLAAGAGASSAVADDGMLAITLSAPTHQRLERAGVRLAATVPGDVHRRRLSFPVARATVGATATVRLAGSLKLAANRRSVVLRSMEATLGGRTVGISGRIGSRRTTLFIARPAATGLRLDGVSGTAAVSSTSVRLTRAAVRVLEKRLGPSARQARHRRQRLELSTSRAFGALALRANGTGTLTPSGAPSASGPDGSSTPASDPAQAGQEDKPAAATRYGCPIAAGGMQGPVGGPPSTPGPPAAAPVLTSPLSASASLSWRFKQSFVSYVTAGAGTVTGGGFAGSGQYQQGATPAGDRLRLDTAGTVVFCYPGHSFWIALGNPTLTIDPAGTSRLTATLETNQFGTEYGPWRTDIAVLAPGTPVRSADNRTVTWSSIAATLTADGAAAFVGMYSAGTPIDAFSLTVSVPDAAAPPAPPAPEPEEEDDDGGGGG